MSTLTETTRRQMLSQATVLFAAGALPSAARFVVADETTRTEKRAGFLRQSQPLPAPRIVLPTDQLDAPKGPKKRIAAITTAYWKYSHADDIITKFIEGYSVVGRTHLPYCKVVSLSIEQFPKTDIGRGMAARYKIPLYKSPAEALTLGGDKLAVDGVLLIGEHGDYPLNEKGQKLYPRQRLFEEIVKVFRRTGKSVPIFNDKHLSYSWDNAKWMYDQSCELKFPLMAGSSVPHTWRSPPLAFRPGIEIESALTAGPGSFESYGFHYLELLQTFVERRWGGEVGVTSVQAISADSTSETFKGGQWPDELFAPTIKLSTQSGKRPPKFGSLLPATVFRIEYSDGFVGFVFLTGAVAEFSFAAKIRDRAEPVATRALLLKPQRDHFSFLCNHVECMFRSGKENYPVERTLLVTGILDALHDSRAAGGKRIKTPHLEKLSYTPATEIGVG